MLWVCSCPQLSPTSGTTHALSRRTPPGFMCKPLMISGHGISRFPVCLFPVCLYSFQIETRTSPPTPRGRPLGKLERPPVPRRVGFELFSDIQGLSNSHCSAEPPLCHCCSRVLKVPASIFTSDAPYTSGGLRGHALPAPCRGRHDIDATAYRLCVHRGPSMAT